MAKSILISNVLPTEARALIPDDVDVDFNDTDTPITKAELIRRLRGKDGLVCHIISTIDDKSKPNFLAFIVIPPCSRHMHMKYMHHALSKTCETNAPLKSKLSGRFNKLCTY